MSEVTQRHRVLVADDSLLYRTQVTDLLTDAGYEVLEAEDGAQAIEIARRERPGVIVLDVMMPNVDGYTALMTLKGDEATKTIPVIMLTTKNEQTYRDIGSGLGAAVYMDKPPDETELLGHVKRLIERA